MVTYKYTDATNNVVHVINADGVSRMSMLASALPQGAAVQPADIVPEPPQTTTPLEFIERFTEAEQLAIVTAAMSVPALRLWYDKLMAAQQVVFDDPRLEAGLDALVASGLITQSRKAAILEQ
jgi:hypothetical protein